MRFRVLTGALLLSLGAGAAYADVINVVTTSTGVGATDHIAWDQLGSDGAAIPQSFTATSGGGLTIGGSYASGTGTVCDSSGVCDSTYSGSNATPAFSDTSILSSRNGAAAGPLTLTFPGGVSAVGTNIVSEYALSSFVNLGDPVPFTASLSVYNGATLLGTVSGTSDDDADPFYLGASDASGANITKAVYAITAAGAAGVDPTSVTIVAGSAIYDNIDNFTCPTATVAQLMTPSIFLACPTAAYDNNINSVVATYDFYLQNQSALIPFTVYDNDGSPSTITTDPNDLGQFYVDGIDFAGGATTLAAAVPEPVSLTLLAAGLVGVGFIRRRGRTASDKATSPLHQ